VKKADIIFMAVPDLLISSVYEKDVKPNLKKGKDAAFSHGFAIHFKTVVRRRGDRRWIMGRRRRGRGNLVRRQYLEAAAFRALIAVFRTEQAGEESRAAWPGASAPRGRGESKRASRRKPRPGSVRPNSVLCGGATSLVQAGYRRW